MKKHIVTILCLITTTFAQGAEKNAPAVQPPPDSEYMGMKLSPDWFPKRETKTQEMTNALAFFAQAAVEGREEGKDIQPGKILWDLEWLMPLDDAEKKLPGLQRAQMGAAALIVTPNFPQRSLFVRSYFGNFTDPHSGEPFKEVRLVADVKRQLVAIQLTYNHPPLIAVKWESQDPSGKAKTPGPAGRREPYYDLLTMKQNGSSRQQVWYGIYRYPTSPGVTCIHTELVEGTWNVGKVIENVRWYLPAPLARKILDIAVPKPASGAGAQKK